MGDEGAFAWVYPFCWWILGNVIAFLFTTDVAELYSQVVYGWDAGDIVHRVCEERHGAEGGYGHDYSDDGKGNTIEG